MIWDDEWNQNLLYMSNIACYPERWNSSIKGENGESGRKSEGTDYRLRKNKARSTHTTKQNTTKQKS